MTAPRDRFAALLRWYPRSWRRANEDVVLATLHEVAADEGRDRPTSAERRAAIVEGLGHRLDRRFAISAAAAAAALGLVAVSLWLASAGWLGGIPAIVVGTGAVPLLVLIALVAAVRSHGRLTSGEALGSIALGVPTAVLAVLAVASWSVGFDEADAGAPRSPLSLALPWILLAAWIGSGAIGAVALGGLLRATGIRTPWRQLAGALGALLISPFLAVAQVSPATGALGALGTLAGVVLLTGPRRGPAPESPPTVRPAPRRRGRSRGLIAVLAATSAIAGSVSIAFALSGALWPGSDLDSTEAMRVGIGLGFLAALPLCVALGAHRSLRHSPASAWGPAALMAASLVVAAAENLTGTGDGNRIVVVLTISAALLGAAVAWMTATGSWSTASARITVGVVAGAALVVIATALQMLPFALPVVAAVVAIVTARPRRPRAAGVAATASTSAG